MKVLIESFDNVTQNKAGGVQMRIKKIMENFSGLPVEFKLFNKWEDNLKDYDILHIFKVTIDSYNLCMLAKKLGLKVVISAVIPPDESIKTNFMLKVPINTCYDLLKKSLQVADKIICQTQKEASYINNVYKIKKDKLEVIPNGVDRRFAVADPMEFRKKYNIYDDFLLQVGRFDKNKNQINVIKALKETNIKVVFIGGEDPSYKEYYKECIRNSNENMIFLGWVSNGDSMLASAYKAAKAVILPSHSEIFGNSLIEGGTAGCNLIITKNLPIDEWGIKDYVSVIDPQNINKIKESILIAMNKENKDNISNIFKDLFSWEKVCRQYFVIYEEVFYGKENLC